MKTSEFRTRFARNDSFGHMNKPNPKKRKGIPIWMIFVAIVVGGLPVYSYLVLTGKMFEFYFVKKIFGGSEPQTVYKSPINSKPEKPWVTNKPIIGHRKGQRKFAPPKQGDELIYSWIDGDGVKQFSNVQPTGNKKALKVTKAYNSTPSKKISRRSSISSVGKARETRVYIRNNQILVPVKLGNNGREVSTLLLLDTGATTTSIHDDLANRFGYFEYQPSKSIIADGSTVKTKRTNFDYIIVGPHRINNFNATVIAYKGRSEKSKGLLGMNFLKNIKYMVDYNRQVIKWL